MSECVIEVEHLTRVYETNTGFFKKKRKSVVAVEDISFKVGKGEIFGLVGPNGAGKTTTIKMLTTLLAPTSGVCKVLGYDTFGQEKSVRSRINFIFGGESGVYRRLSARDNLVYFSNLYKIPSKVQKERIPKLLELVGLADRADYRVETFSKGMIQRLQIAKGLINEPEVVFMDEPTIGLDPVGAEALRNIIRELSAKEVTVFLTSHNMYEIQELCKNVAIIDKGHIIVCDTVTNLLEGIDNISTIDIIVNSHIDKEKLFSIEGVISSEWQTEGKVLCVKYETAKSNIIACVIEMIGSENIRKIDVSEPSLENVYIKFVGGKKNA